jgi:hypothetical protein
MPLEDWVSTTLFIIMVLFIDSLLIQVCSRYKDLPAEIVAFILLITTMGLIALFVKRLSGKWKAVLFNKND